MQTNPKMDAAMEATSNIDAVLYDAMYELEYHLYEPRNAFGCHDDIKEVKRDMGTAIEKLCKALSMIDEVNWPKDKEFEKVLGDEGFYIFP